jgi:hypothetical protein
MAKPRKTQDEKRVELVPNAWSRFERFVQDIAKAGPQHRSQSDYQVNLKAELEIRQREGRSPDLASMDASHGDSGHSDADHERARLPAQMKKPRRGERGFFESSGGLRDGEG